MQLKRGPFKFYLKSNFWSLFFFVNILSMSNTVKVKRGHNDACMCISDGQSLVVFLFSLIKLMNVVYILNIVSYSLSNSYYFPLFYWWSNDFHMSPKLRRLGNHTLCPQPKIKLPFTQQTRVNLWSCLSESFNTCLQLAFHFSASLLVKKSSAMNHDWKAWPSLLKVHLSAVL